MSREYLRGTTEAALTVAETYQELLKQRAQRLTGEDGSKPISVGEATLNLLIAGDLVPTHNIFQWMPEPTTYGPELTQTLGEGTAHRAQLVREVTESIEASQKRQHQAPDGH